MPDQVPASLRTIAHYVKIANENATRDPVIYYWALFYAVQTGMAIDKTSAEAKQYLTGILVTLEQVKKRMTGNEAISQDVVAQSHIENYALQLFNYADCEDRKGNFTKNVVKAFYTAGHLFDILSLFGELDEQIAANRKYAKWKATYIHNCLKNGEQPVPGPPSGNAGEEDDEFAQFTNTAHTTGDLSDAKGHGGFPSQPAAAHPANVVSSSGSTSTHATFPSAPASASTSTPSTASATLTAVDWTEAAKLTKYAMSAITYEDAAAAIDNLHKAIAILTKK